MEAEHATTPSLENTLKCFIEKKGIEVLPDTPGRFVSALNEMLSGYKFDPENLIKTFPHDGKTIVTCNKIGFSSLCEHHLSPFFGMVSITYLPAGRIIGLSKLARVVQALSQRLQTQERLTEEIAETIWSIQPVGVKVKIKAIHTCMCCRGVKMKSETTTRTTRGILD